MLTCRNYLAAPVRYVNERPQAGQLWDRLDAHPGRLAVEEHRVIDDGLARDGACRLGAGQPVRGPGDYGARLIADQRNSSGSPGAGPARGPATGGEAHFDVEPVGAQQPGQHRGEVRMRAEHHDAARVGLVDVAGRGHGDHG